MCLVGGGEGGCAYLHCPALFTSPFSRTCLHIHTFIPLFTHTPHTHTAYTQAPKHTTPTTSTTPALPPPSPAQPSPSASLVQHPSSIATVDEDDMLSVHDDSSQQHTTQQHTTQQHVKGKQQVQAFIVDVATTDDNDDGQHAAAAAADGGGASGSGVYTTNGGAGGGDVSYADICMLGEQQDSPFQQQSHAAGFAPPPATQPGFVSSPPPQSMSHPSQPTSSRAVEKLQQGLPLLGPLLPPQEGGLLLQEEPLLSQGTSGDMLTKTDSATTTTTAPTHPPQHNLHAYPSVTSDAGSQHDPQSFIPALTTNWSRVDHTLLTNADGSAIKGGELVVFVVSAQVCCFVGGVVVLGSVVMMCGCCSHKVANTLPLDNVFHNPPRACTPHVNPPARVFSLDSKNPSPACIPPPTSTAHCE